MTNEELQTLLPLAAKAIGICAYEHNGRFFYDGAFDNAHPFIPHEDGKQCAWMNAALEHNTSWLTRFRDIGPGLLQITDLVEISHTSGVAVEVEHDGTMQDKLRAWMEASVRAAAKVGEKK